MLSSEDSNQQHNSVFVSALQERVLSSEDSNEQRITQHIVARRCTRYYVIVRHNAPIALSVVLSLRRSTIKVYLIF